MRQRVDGNSSEAGAWGSARRHPVLAAGALFCAAMLAPWCVAAQTTEGPSANWRHTVTVVSAGEEDPILQAAFTHVTALGVKQTVAAQVLGDLNRHVHEVTLAAGKVRLCLGLVVDVVVATSAANWSPEESSVLLLALQRDLDKGRPLDELKQAVGRISANATVAAVQGQWPPARRGGKEEKAGSPVRRP